MKYTDMPKGVMQINLIQIFSTFGFAVLLGTLNLYLQSKGMPVGYVNTLTASFFALNFLLHFFGGAIGGRFLSYRSLFASSLILQAIGLIGIAQSNTTVVLTGMACFLTGSGLNVSCINLMLTQLFDEHDKRRRIAFSVNYSCMNIGFILSYCIANYFQSYHAYGTAFIIAAGCVLFSFVLHIFSWRHFADKATFFATTFNRHKARWFAGPSVIVGFFVASLFLMHHAEIASALIYVSFIFAFVYMLWLASKQTPEYRNKMIAYIILVAACMVFAFVQGLQSTGLQNFVKYNTNLSFLGIHIEPSGFNMFESLGVIIFAFILARSMRVRQTQNRPFRVSGLISRGLSFNIIAFLMIPLGIFVAQQFNTDITQLFFPILLLIFVAIAEVHVNAINYAMAGELSQPKHHGICTGYLFINIAMGVNFSGLFSNIILGKYTDLSDVAPSVTNPMYMKMFLLISVIAAIITLAYIAMGKWLDKLMHFSPDGH